MTYSFSERLLLLLEQRGFSQRSLAKKSGLGSSHVNRICRGVVTAELEDIYRIGAALDLDPCELVDADELAGALNGSPLLALEVQRLGAEVRRAQERAEALEVRLALEKQKTRAAAQRVERLVDQSARIEELENLSEELQLQRDSLSAGLETCRGLLRQQRARHAELEARAHAWVSALFATD